MMRLDRNALDGFLKDVGPVPGLPWGMAPARAEAEEVPIPFVVQGGAGPSAPAVPPVEEALGSAEEQTGGYALMVIEGAAVTPSEEAVGRQEAVPSRAPEGAGVDVAAASMAASVSVRAPELSSEAPVSHQAVGQVEERLYPSLEGGLEGTAGALLPRRRWPLMAAAGVALAGAAVLLALPIARREHSTPATETARQEGSAERAPVASASQVPIPEPAPHEASAALEVAPRPQAEEAMREMRFPGAFYRNSSHPYGVDAAAVGDIVRLLRERCVDGSIVVEGHTCDLGDARLNRELSLRRAHRVGEYLVRAGFAPERLRFVGQGDRQPIADNRLSEGKRQNRRVMISCDPDPQGHSRQPGTSNPGAGSR